MRYHFAADKADSNEGSASAESGSEADVIVRDVSPCSGTPRSV